MSLFITMFFYSISMSVSPGPVNLITFASGVNFGVRKTLPFVAGATVGFIFLLFLVGVGLNTTLASQQGMLTEESLEIVLQILTFAACLFIGYLGVKVATARVELDAQADTPPGFKSGFLFQWLNPKAWLASIAGVTAFELVGSIYALIIFVGIYFCCCFPCVCLWAIAGDKLGNLVKQRGYLRWLNLTMGGLLIFVAGYLLMDGLFSLIRPL